MDRSYNNKTTEGLPEESNLGSLLRKSREARHIDLDEAVEATRIRRNYLEALENEEWSNLPSQVFVKGFLRSYAEFLGLDKEMVQDCYLRTSPFQKYTPHVLKEVGVKSGRWHLISIISFLVLALIAAIIYLKKSNISIVEKTFQYLQIQGPAEKKENALEREDSTVQDDKEKEALLIPAENLIEKEKEIASKPKSVEEATTPIETEAERALPPQFILTADVKSQTWIAIYIDDEPVKEYLLQPGETVRWEAAQGFDILVGNAGGIEFFLNGKEVGSLGPEGKVVRVKIPEGHE